MRVGILGGSFDPVHLGHVALAEAARDRLALDRVLLVVARSQPLKPGGPAAGGEDRLAMVRLAVEGRPRLEASDLELRRPGPSYTVDTLRALRTALPPGAELLLLLGADALAEMPRWREAAEVRRMASVVAGLRAGAPAPAGADLLLDAAPPALSSTEIRRRAAGGEPLEGLVPPAVAA
ncbi:MAG: nicotinate (nicotinamide) nucleotide adenylyltransferase, partial [Planctomycetes bacterium]|nr:nicotinate (nicotinamide) nucleotide adenylyltransferase [Planctomycetota bacterium]